MARMCSASRSTAWLRAESTVYWQRENLTFGDAGNAIAYMGAMATRSGMTLAISDLSGP